jgi:hypothetical protein
MVFIAFVEGMRWAVVCDRRALAEAIAGRGAVFMSLHVGTPCDG